MRSRTSGADSIASVPAAREVAVAERFDGVPERRMGEAFRGERDGVGVRMLDMIQTCL